MNFIKLTYCFFLIPVNVFGQNELLFWSETRKLDFKDFQYSPDYPSIRNLPDAISAVGLIVVYNNESENSDCYQLRAVFYKNKSYMLQEDKSLLEHEQLHFDLMEILARRLRKRIAEAEIDIDNFDLNHEINCLINECNDINGKYDIETMHGTNIKMQLQWALMVKEELKKLKKYGDEILICLPK